MSGRDFFSIIFRVCFFVLSGELNGHCIQSHQERHDVGDETRRFLRLESPGVELKQNAPRGVVCLSWYVDDREDP